MDTDDLSILAYKSIIMEDEKFNHNFSLQCGILASSWKDDDETLNKAEILFNDWLQVNNLENIINGTFLRQKVNKNAFRKTLNKVLANFAEISKIPMDYREFEDWG